MRLLSVAIAIVLLGPASAVCRAAAPAPAARPNFLFLYTDDQRFDALGVVQREQGEAGRFPWLRTPNMDRLAAEGVRFRNAFVVSALCAPSRAAFLTGRYNHLNGVANNHTPFPADNVTWASLLGKAGYATAYCGKWHHGVQSGPRPGFSYSASFVGQGKYADGPFEVNGKKTDTNGWVDDVTTDFAIDFIRRQQGEPFAVAVGFKSSHGPWQPPERLAGELADAVSRPPPNGDAVPPFKSAPAVGTKHKAGARQPATGPSDAISTGRDKSAMQRNYFRTLLGVDQNVGRLLAALDELKLADDTVVVFSSDNGYYLGEHGLGDKRSAYEESIRVPLLVRYPKLGPAAAGRTVDLMALNVDVAPTFLDLAGVPVPAEVQGRSLRPLLAGEPPAGWRTAWFYEYFFERGFQQPTTLAVRTESAKLIKYPGHDDWTELFDLKADPHERANLYKDPKAADLRGRMEREFDAQAKAVAFKVPATADDPAAAGPGAAVPAGEPAVPFATAARAAPPAGEALPAKPPAGPVLSFDLSAGTGKEPKIPDRTKSGNDGIVKGSLPLAAGRDRNQVRRFEGKSHIEVPKSPSLNPAGVPFAVEVVFRADRPGGVLVARGGKSFGYALLLEKGRPTFVVTTGDKPTRVQADRDVTAKWARVVARVTADRRLTLEVDDEPAAESPLPSFIGRDPSDPMQIGADTGTPVTDEPVPAVFVGLMESVRVTAGEPAAGDAAAGPARKPPAQENPRGVFDEP